MILDFVAFDCKQNSLIVIKHTCTHVKQCVYVCVCMWTSEVLWGPCGMPRMPVCVCVNWASCVVSPSLWRNRGVCPVPKGIKTVQCFGHATLMERLDSRSIDGLLRLQAKARQSSVSLITLRSRAISSQWQSCKPKLRMAVTTAIKEQAHAAALKPSQSKRDSHHLLQSENTARACPLSSPLLFLAHQVDSCGLCL